MSSANNFEFVKKPSARSIIYNKNWSGPSIKLSETAALISAQKEVCPLRTTVCFLFLNKFDNRFKRLTDMPFYFSLNIRPSYNTLSKALDISSISSNTQGTSKPSSNNW